MKEYGATLFGTEQGDANAQYNLGVMYMNGEGVEQSTEEAIKWAKKAAEQGHEMAIQALESLNENVDEE